MMALPYQFSRLAGHDRTIVAAIGEGISHVIRHR